MVTGLFNQGDLTVRVLVERTFHISGRGPVIAGLLLEGEVSSGDLLVVEETRSTLRVRGLEMHLPQPEGGRRVGLLVRPEDAPKVSVGSTLISPPARPPED
jgi:selenocysteine-specific translation elongation factor